MWIDGPTLPDSAFGQNVTFEGCLAIFNVPTNPPPQYRQAIEEAIAKAYAANVLVLFLLDDTATLDDPPDWIDFLECSFGIAPLRVISKGRGKIVLPFLPDERMKVLKEIAEDIWKFGKIKLVSKNFQVMGTVTIDNEKVLMPLTEVKWVDGNS